MFCWSLLKASPKPSTQHYYNMKKIDSKYNSQTIQQSCFYKLYSEEYLYKILKISKNQFNKLLEQKNKILIHSQKPDKKRKLRDYTYPPENSKLWLLYREFLRKFDRIKKPDYLFSCKKCVSHVFVAKYHSNCSSLVTIDIKSFFPSITYYHLFDFFKNTMKCSENISQNLSNLLTDNGKFMQGPCFSPILSWLCFKKMFDEINSEAQKLNLKFSLWIDDIAISGTGSHKFIDFIKTKFAEYGLKIKWKKLQKYNHLNDEKEIMSVLIINNSIYAEENADLGYKKHIARVGLKTNQSQSISSYSLL